MAAVWRGGWWGGGVVGFCRMLLLGVLVFWGCIEDEMSQDERAQLASCAVSDVLIPREAWGLLPLGSGCFVRSCRRRPRGATAEVCARMRSPASCRRRGGSRCRSAPGQAPGEPVGLRLDGPMFIGWAEKWCEGGESSEKSMVAMPWEFFYDDVFGTSFFWGHMVS